MRLVPSPSCAAVMLVGCSIGAAPDNRPSASADGGSTESSSTADPQLSSDVLAAVTKFREANLSDPAFDVSLGRELFPGRVSQQIRNPPGQP